MRRNGTLLAAAAGTGGTTGGFRASPGGVVTYYGSATPGGVPNGAHAQTDAYQVGEGTSDEQTFFVVSGAGGGGYPGGASGRFFTTNLSVLHGAEGGMGGTSIHPPHNPDDESAPPVVGTSGPNGAARISWYEPEKGKKQGFQHGLKFGGSRPVIGPF